jgi:hypothetical protein
MMNSQIKKFMQQNALSGPGTGLVVPCSLVVHEIDIHVLFGGAHGKE